ncbi:amidohydrolase family protein [Streptomyces sp. NPDC093223]|uniref:amidohydrolase family protein n=1 Tax=Streptomyces sp. NPDC093223 TaxID=3366033 RepID=UPI003812B0E6
MTAFIDFSVQPPTEEFLAELRRDDMSGYDRTYALATGDFPTVPALVEALEAADGQAVIKAIDARSTRGLHISNRHVADLCAAGRGRFVGFAGVDPHAGARAVEELEEAVDIGGLRGLNLQLYHHKMRADDERLRPLYETCLRLGIPVNLHIGMSFSGSPMRFGDPLAVDAVACDLPDLRIICAPPGFPWIRELIAVAWRHRNVHIGLSGLRPKYLGKADSGWTELLAYGTNILREKILFGSAHPLLPIQRSIDEVRALPLPDEVARMWLHDNARRVLGDGHVA